MNTITTITTHKLSLAIIALVLTAQAASADSNAPICRGVSLPACTDHTTRRCDEGKNNLGANRCRVNEDCIAGRSCSPFSWCQGTQSIPVIDCNPPTPSVPIICKGAQQPACTDHITRICNEGANSNGANRCNSNADCIVGRTCSPFGWCQGTQSVQEVDCPAPTLGVCASDSLPACTLHSTRLCDEGKNIFGANRCNSDADCILGRTCSPFGWCQGTQNVNVIKC